MERIQGHCPMGCGETLFLGDGGHVTCSWVECPRPTAVDELLASSEIEHRAMIRETSFTIEHPLRERLDGELHKCVIHEELQALCGPPSKPGLYRLVPRHPDLDSEPYRPGQLPGWDLERIS